MMEGKDNTVHMIAFILLVIGGLNWLLVALFGWDISNFLPGGMTGWTARFIYLLVGLSAIYEIATHKARCRGCETMMQKKASSGGPMS